MAAAESKADSGPPKTAFSCKTLKYLSHTSVVDPAKESFYKRVFKRIDKDKDELITPMEVILTVRRVRNSLSDCVAARLVVYWVIASRERLN